MLVHVVIYGLVWASVSAWDDSAPPVIRLPQDPTQMPLPSERPRSMDAKPMSQGNISITPLERVSASDHAGSVPPTASTSLKRLDGEPIPLKKIDPPKKLPSEDQGVPAPALPAPTPVPVDPTLPTKSTLDAEAKTWVSNAPPANAPSRMTTASDSNPLANSVAANLAVEQTVPREIEPGKQASVQLVVVNRGNHQVANVVLVTEPLGCDVVRSEPPFRTVIGQPTWSLGTLKAGERRAIQLDINPKANVEGEAPSLKSTVSCDVSSTASMSWVKPSLMINISGPTRTGVGESITLNVEVANTGRIDARDVEVLDELPAGLTHPAGQRLFFKIDTLKAGEIKRSTLTLNAVQPGIHTNLLKVKALNVAQLEKRTAIDITRPDLQISATGPKLRYVNRPVTYEIVVANKGSSLAKNAVVKAVLSDSMSCSEATQSGTIDAKTRTVSWEISELPPGETKKFQLVALPAQMGEHVSIASVTMPGNVSQQAEISTKVVGAPAVLVDVADLEDPVELGGEANYEVRVVNQGTSPATGVKVTIELPTEMTLVQADGPARHQQVARTITYEVVDKLAPKADLVFRIKAKCDKAGDCRLRVHVLTNELTKAVLNEASTTVISDN